MTIFNLPEIVKTENFSLPHFVVQEMRANGGALIFFFWVFLTENEVKLMFSHIWEIS